MLLCVQLRVIAMGNYASLCSIACFCIGLELFFVLNYALLQSVGILLCVQLRVTTKGYFASLCSDARYCEGLLWFSVFNCGLLRNVTMLSRKYKLIC